MKHWTLLFAAVTLLPAAALADVPPPQAPPPALPTPWSGDAALGYIRTTGNVDSTSLSVKGNLDWISAPWSNHAHTMGNYSSSLGASTAESYEFDDKLSRDLDPSQYLFASFNYTDDRFAGVVSRFSEAVGYGRHFIKTPTQTLDIDAGLGLSQERESGYQGYDGEFIGVFNLAYLYKFSPTAQFKQTLHIESAVQNTYINPVSELKFTIVGNFFATLDYDWRHNTSVPDGTVHTDTITSINFGYSFGKKPG
jgi:putative salt-induced outer membrane protein YdiY